MAGLDPAIHLSGTNHSKTMDTRVRPACDEVYFAPTNSVGVLPVICRNACEKAGTLA
jgi:hypothetical protein